MKIEFKKGREKDTLSCTRPDGSITWMTSTAFFTTHDLAHYVIETNLKIKSGFYGLLGNGMAITDFENKQKFRPNELPAETIQTEHLVNLLLTEISDQRHVENFQAVFDKACLASGLPLLSIDKSVLELIRKDLNDLLQRWMQLPDGQSLQLSF